MNCAANIGHYNGIRGRLNSNADLNANVTNRNTTLHIRAYRGYKDAAKPLLAKGADVTCLASENLTPHQYATNDGHCDVIKELLNSKADINAKDINGNTHLRQAYNGYTNAIKTLLSKGADLTSLDKNNEIALHFAAAIGHRDAIKELMNSNA